MGNPLLHTASVLYSISNLQVTVNTSYVLPLLSHAVNRCTDMTISLRSSSRMTTCSGMSNPLSFPEEVYVHFSMVDFFFIHLPLIISITQIKLRPAEGLETEQWILTPTSAETHDDDDGRWYLQQRVGRFSGRTPSC